MTIKVFLKIIYSEKNEKKEKTLIIRPIYK